jgi:hypothetical protein
MTNQSNSTALTGAESHALIAAVFAGGLEEFNTFLQTLDPNQAIDPRDRCGCFMWEYFSRLCPAGRFIIGIDIMIECTTDARVEEVPVWYVVFQQRAINRANKEYPAYAKLPVFEASDIVADMLANPPEDTKDLAEDYESENNYPDEDDEDDNDEYLCDCDDCQRERGELPTEEEEQDLDLLQ